MSMAASVLIVDDHAGFRSAARRLLELEGYVVVGEAVDGLSAITEARRLRPDLVLLDIQLPDVDGFEVCEQLCRAGDGPAVVLTSSRDARRLRPVPRPHPRVWLRPEGGALRRRDRGYPSCVKQTRHGVA